MFRYILFVFASERFSRVGGTVCHVKYYASRDGKSVPTKQLRRVNFSAWPRVAFIMESDNQNGIIALERIVAIEGRGIVSYSQWNILQLYNYLHYLITYAIL